MKGTLLEFSIQRNEGLISGDDGKRYKFSGSEWKVNQDPRQGLKVDFEVEGERAIGVYLDSSYSPGGPRVSVSDGQKKKSVAAILAILLGSFGAHKFYLGYTNEAIIMLIVSLLGWILAGAGLGFAIIFPFIMGIVAFIEFVIYLTKSDTDFEKTYIVGKKSWF